MRLPIAIAAIAFASPAFAQELDLDFDSFYFEDESEIIIDKFPEHALEV